MASFTDSIQAAHKKGALTSASVENILSIYQSSSTEKWMQESLEELVDNGNWTELNDRFYKAMSFGTGGIRGRTIGKVVTMAEQGGGGLNDSPEHAAVGTNAMNDFNVARAVIGLTTYVQKQFPNEKPRVVFSHDTRHFSRHFAKLAASIVQEMGGTAFLFEAERSTPELSFAVRHLKAHAGAMLTASHNPPHDNGFKAYFADGGQCVEPHASGIIAEVLKVEGSKVAHPAAVKGQIQIIGKELDEAYLTALKTLVLEPDVIRSQSAKLKIVYTPLHGTGIKSIPAILDTFGFSVIIEPEQAKPDGRFPTVQSPNPENAEALTRGIDLAKKEGADIVMATDPDADRMGVAVRARNGEFQLLTGNQIGSVMAAYRLERFFAKGILTSSNASHATLIKTFVTTDLQDTIAKSYGVKCINTLTGFKYIGEKLKNYEDAAGGRGTLDFPTWRSKLLEKSSFFVFGGEESYGYSGGDYVRDKDANAAVLMCAEAAAWAASQGLNLLEYLDLLYTKHGYYSEKLGTLTFEGAEGAAKIQKLLQSYKSNPPDSFCGYKLQKTEDYQKDVLHDIDGKRIPSELMLMFHLDGGFRIAVRGSGTEPKIKYYFFGRADVASEKELPEVKEKLKKILNELWSFTQEDAGRRAA